MKDIEGLIQYDLTKRDRSMLSALIAGSASAKDRLFHIGRVDNTTCICGCPKQTIEHILWDCPHEEVKKVRDQYFKHIEGVHVSLQCVQCNMIDNKAYRNTSLMAEDGALLEEEAKLSITVEDPVQYPPKMVSNKDSDLECWQEGYRRVFTDGARHHPDDNRLGRASYTVFYGFGDSRNTAGVLHGVDQTPYRAELRGALAALEQADVPTWVTLDNEAVVTTASIICRGYKVKLDKMSSRDLWERLERAVQRHPPGYFVISWIKGHIDQHPEYVNEGKFTQREADWHIECDRLASEKSNSHQIHDIAYQGAILRIKISLLTQTMFFKIWKVAIAHLGVVSEELAERLLNSDTDNPLIKKRIAKGQRGKTFLNCYQALLVDQL